MQDKPVEALKDQRICVVGAGSAGMGVTQMIAKGMRKHVRAALGQFLPSPGSI